jgi:hypothetical protein
MNNKEVSSMKENSSMKVEGEMGFYSLFKSWAEDVRNGEFNVYNS